MRMKRMNSLKLTRHEMRVRALQALFSLEYNGTISMEDAILFAVTYDQPDEELNIDEASMNELTQFVSGIIDNRLEIDQMIAPHLRRWTVSRLPKVDLTILRMAIYEMTQSIAAPIAISESIQLAKTFSDDKSRRFINAVLNNVKESIQQ